MGFVIFGDSACNLPRAQLEQFQVQTISFSIEMDGKLVPCPKYPEAFDGKAYYDYLRNKGVVKTSLLPAGQIMEAFRPTLAAGEECFRERTQMPRVLA